MVEQLDQSELVSFTELLLTNSIQVDTLTQLLIEKGTITEDEFYTKLKQIQMEYRSKDDD
jgi:AmiR/NasT family two-component response regulator